MRLRIDAEGSAPKFAAMLSVMWCALEVAGITQVTAGCDTMNLRKNWPQLLQSNSRAHSGKAFPFTLRNREPRWKGRLPDYEPMTHILHRHCHATYPTAVGGDGCYLIDSSGKRYVEDSCFLYAQNI